jgi:penicillin-binding protein 1C
MHLHRDEADGMHDLAFPPPSGHTAVQICAYTGKISSGNCPSTFREWFPEGELPETDTQHQTLRIDTRNQLLASPWTPEQWTQQRRVIDLPPRYLEWAQSHGIPLAPKDYSLLDAPEQIALAGTVFDAGPQMKLSGQRITLSIDSPKSGMRIIHNPEMPASINSIALKATADPAIDQVLWYVDGEPYKLADAPFSVRWPLEPGTHRFQARVPYRRERSETVVITVE